MPCGCPSGYTVARWLFAVCMGLSLSWYEDTPAGPSIVVSAAALFLLSFAWRRRS